MKEYDLIIAIVDQPGSIAEATTIALKPHLAQKSILFQDQEFAAGFVASACRSAADIGAHLRTFTYPGDLDDCHLLSHVEERVRLVQKMKYLL